MEEENPKWTDEEAEILRHEAFIAEVLQRRSGPDNKEPQKPAWQRFFESTGGAALITVLLGGILGQCITSQVQKGLKEREFQQAVSLRDREFEQAWLKARGDQALLAYQEYLKGEQETVKQAYELIGSCISASEDLVSLTVIDFNPYHPDYNLQERKVVYDQRTAIYNKFNEVSSKWRNERDKLGLLMSYYHKGEHDIASAWQATAKAVTDYMDFAQNWEDEHPEANLNKDEVNTINETKKKPVQESLTKLAESLNKGRRYAWEGWDSLENLKAVIENRK